MRMILFGVFITSFLVGCKPEAKKEETAAVVPEKKPATEMLDRVLQKMPAARLRGFTVSPFVKRPHAHELILGISETMVSGYLSSTYRDAIAFVLLVVILLLKPAGLLGKAVPEKV